MKVYCPKVQILPETRAALDASKCDWAPVDVTGSDTAYTELLQQLWRGGETFAIVEHDIVPWRGALNQFDECPRLWCSFAYPFGNGTHAGLGCVRFRAELLANCPTAVDDTLTEASETHPRAHWCQLDDRLTRALTRLGAVKHVHTPNVGHMHPYPSHGCS